MTTFSSEMVNLHPEHLADLRASGLNDETLKLMGVYSARPADIPKLVGRNPEKVESALVFPYPGANGFCRIKAFPSYRDEKGHLVKYLQKKDSGCHLYILPSVQEALANPSCPASIVEGEKKAAKGQQGGLFCIGVGGLWNWMEKGTGKGIEDFDRIAWKDRPVMLIPDSDTWTRDDLQRAVFALGKELERRKAIVHVLVLPQSGEEKIGLDDYLLKHSTQELESLQRLTLKDEPLSKHKGWWKGWQEEKKEGGRIKDSPYRIKDGRIVRVKLTNDGRVIYPLCNFIAGVTEETILDDGAETSRIFQIEGKLDNGQRLPSARVPGNKFNGMGWVTESWGLRAIVHAGQTTRDYLREAIQTLSHNARSRRVFTHTGWREIDKRWIYLTTGGAVGQTGFEVDLGTELSRYRLPYEAHDRVDAMRTSLELLDLAPFCITAPLWAGVFRAPLANAYPVDLSIWLEGMTGSLKSTLAALFLSHYGDFDRIHLPGVWSSTANQLERRAFLLKDVLFVVDDYAPGAMDRRELETKASRLLRSQGNLAGRGRLKSDLTERLAYPPRGLILATGEQHPPGQSLLARTLVVELKGEQINMEVLNKAQSLSSRLSHAMAGYIAWLGPQMSQMPKLLRESFRLARERALSTGNHLRIPEVLAHLWIGLDCGFKYAEEIGACSPNGAKDLNESCWSALLDLGNAQGRLVAEERPSLRFLRVLSNLIAQGRATLLPKSDPESQPSIGTDHLGWFDEDHLYLLPDASFMVVSRFCRETSEPLLTRQDRLKKDLVEEGVSDVDPSRLTAVVKIGGKSRRILKLNRTGIEGLLNEQLPLPSY